MVTTKWHWHEHIADTNRHEEITSTCPEADGLSPPWQTISQAGSALKPSVHRVCSVHLNPINSREVSGIAQILNECERISRLPLFREPKCTMQTVWFCSHINFASFQLMVFSSYPQLTSTERWNKNHAYSIFSHSVVSLEQNLYQCRVQSLVSVLDTFWALKRNVRRLHVVRTGHCNAAPFTPRAKGPQQRPRGKGKIWTDYPFTGFLQIWRSVSCVVACVPSIRAALIFFLFAVLIIFITRRFPWLLGGFLKQSTTKLKTEFRPQKDISVTYAKSCLITWFPVPGEYWGGDVGWKVFLRWSSWSYCHHWSKGSSVFTTGQQRSWVWDRHSNRRWVLVLAHL